MKQRHTAFLLLAVGVLLYAYLFFSNPQDQPVPLGKPEETDLENIGTQEIASNNRTPISPMAKILSDSDGSALADLQALGDIFLYYPLKGNRALPTGTNREITEALTQRVDASLPYLPSDHPQINDDGELVDRWHTPYFFHALSSKEMEVRSAGPDQILYTEDDLVWPNEKPLKNPKPIFEEAVLIR